MNMAWKFQIPAFILSDKTLSEGTYSVDPAAVHEVTGAGTHHGGTGLPRISGTLRAPDGVSPLAFPGTKDAVIKANSYAHDEAGITTEDAAIGRTDGKETSSQG